MGQTRHPRRSPRIHSLFYLILPDKASGQPASVPGPILFSEESALHRADLNLQISFFHKCLWPDARCQCLLGDHLAGTVNQSGEDVESTTTEPHGLVTLEQEPPRRDEPEDAERDGRFGHGASPESTLPFT